MTQQVLPTYTPFATSAMGTLGDALARRDENRKEDYVNQLAREAYMGGPDSPQMQELMAEDPDRAMEIEKQAQQRQARERQAEAHQQSVEKNRRTFAAENYQLINDLSVQVGGIGDYDRASEHLNAQVAQLSPIIGEENAAMLLESFSPEQHEAFKELRQVVTGDDWERSGGPVLEEIDGKPTYVQKFVNPKTQEVRSVPTSTAAAITGHDPDRKRDLAYAGEQGKIQAQVDLEDTVAFAKLGAEAKTRLAPMRQTTTETIGLLDQLRNHPGLKNAVGVGWLNPLKYAPGTDARDFMVMADQVQGRVFEQAYETLKGAGPITEVEALKAETAKARMDQSQSPAEYLRALDEFEQALRDGYQVLLDQASGKAAEDVLGDDIESVMALDKAPTEGLGSSSDQPIVVKPGDTKPPAGTWVKLPDGRTVRVKG